MERGLGEVSCSYSHSYSYSSYFSSRRYKCPVASCPRNQALGSGTGGRGRGQGQGRSQPCGFKEYTIHVGVAHHMVEKVGVLLLASPTAPLP